jgi:hypothetical protein
MEFGVCSKCKQRYLREKIGIHPSNSVTVYVNKSGKKMKGNTCYRCARKRGDSYYAKNKQIWRNYEKKPAGFLMRAYRNMRSRVLGIQWKKAHLYEGKALLTKEEFYAWAAASSEFKALFKTWKKSGMDRKLTPSVNRKDPKLGYQVSNMEWITHSENSRLGAINRTL